jgi:hypothetical protein
MMVMSPAASKIEPFRAATVRERIRETKQNPLAHARGSEDRDRSSILMRLDTPLALGLLLHDFLLQISRDALPATLSKLTAGKVGNTL